MKFRVVVGDAKQVRGVVELDAHSYNITEQGMLVILGGNTPPHPIVTYAPGAWRSVVEVDGFRKALQPGSVSDEATRVEDSRRRQAQR